MRAAARTPRRHHQHCAVVDIHVASFVGSVVVEGEVLKTEDHLLKAPKDLDTSSLQFASDQDLLTIANPHFRLVTTPE